ncbi:MAG: sigma 54-interacting transcriptional regulator, partial [Vicinamibacteria bacterium]|nr:sigma 54-interacting transcriptional regulator [Vicinamibacteria bacterium]
MGERPALLIVEDHEESRAGLTCALEKKGFLVHQARDGKSALGIAAREDLQAAIVDLRLPDIDGLKVLNELLAHRPGLPVVVVTAYASIDTAVAAMKQGAADFLTKPLRLDDLLRVLDRSLAQRAQAGPAARPINLEMAQFGILGGSALMRDVFDRIKRIAPYYRTVLILGESGTGKELVARALHALGPGPTQPFVAVNCATLSEQLLESEIFGHERGAFTSADQAKVGMMEAANKGTIFLDEVNEMGLAC